MIVLPLSAHAVDAHAVVTYVECGECHSPNTLLEKDHASKLFFLSCQSCGCRKSVASIKTGYHAVSRGERNKNRQ